MSLGVQQLNLAGWKAAALPSNAQRGWAVIPQDLWFLDQEAVVTGQVTLSSSLDEIRALVRNRRAADAIAFCKHILRFYPKHAETYLLMAQANLDDGKLDAARELFRRVLSADPESVMAYAGLAAIYEQQRLMEQAVWHLERAHDLAPTDSEIRQELLRVYSIADGQVRDRVKLTPGALARLYAHEGLYTQAIQEFRQIISAVPTRYDVRTALIETYWRVGQKREAAEAAQELLDALPYCLKANLILGAVWSENGEKESETYLRRAQAVDPMNLIAQSLLGEHSPLRARQALVPQYEGTAPIAEPEPAPAFSSQEAAATETTTSRGTRVETVYATPPPEVTPGTTAEAEADSELPIAPMPKPDLPDPGLPPWLRADFRAPEKKETPPPQAAVQPETSAGGIPIWFFEMQKSFGGATPGVMPLWEEPKFKEEPRTKDERPQVMITEPPPGSIQNSPEWLKPIQPPEEETRVEEREPSFKKEDRVESERFRATPPEASEDASSADETPDWLKSLQSPTAGTQKISQPDDRDEPAWLDSTQDESSSQESSSTEEMPEWLRLATQSNLESAEKEQAHETQVPDWLSKQEQSAAATESKKEDDKTPDWLRELRRASDAAAVEPEKPEEPIVPTPAWFGEASSKTTSVEKSEPAPPPKQVSAERKEKPARSIPETPAWVRAATGETARARPPARASVEIPKLESEPRKVAPKAKPIPSAPAVSMEKPTTPKTKPPAKGLDRLNQARELKEINRLDDALANYDYVVQHSPRLVKDVIGDLESLVQRGGVPLDAHRVLGDAYSRVGRLNDALARYRFVMDHSAKSSKR